MVLRSGRVGATVLTTRSRRPARSTSLGIEKAITEHRWRRWESNPERSDTLTLRGHSVFPRIAVKGTEPDLLLPYPAVPSNALACPALWSLFGH